MPTPPSVQMWIMTHKCLVRIKDPHLINAPSPRTYKLRYKRIRTQQYIKQNTRSKEIQQAKPGWPDNSQSTRPSPSHQQTSPQIGTTTQLKALPTGGQPKRIAKPPTSTGPASKHAACCNTSAPFDVAQPINIPKGPEYEKYQHYIDVGEEFYQLHVAQRQLLQPNNLKKRILQK